MVIPLIHFSMSAEHIFISCLGLRSAQYAMACLLLFWFGAYLLMCIMVFRLVFQCVTTTGWAVELHGLLLWQYCRSHSSISWSVFGFHCCRCWCHHQLSELGCCSRFQHCRSFELQSMVSLCVSPSVFSFTTGWVDKCVASCWWICSFACMDCDFASKSVSSVCTIASNLTSINLPIVRLNFVCHIRLVCIFVCLIIFCPHKVWASSSFFFFSHFHQLLWQYSLSHLDKVWFGSEHDEHSKFLQQFFLSNTLFTHQHQLCQH